DELVGKWFRGSDHPLALDANGVRYTYRYANGSLFVNGVSYTDIRQGAVGDCYYLSALAEMAMQTPGLVQTMFSDNGDSTYTVRFFHNGVADYVTVDRYLPTDTQGRFVYACQGDYASSTGNELWVALAEKAYAQVNEEGWLGQPRDGTNAYCTRPR